MSRMLSARALFAACVLLSFVVLFSPGSAVPSAPPGVDKLVHGGLFLGLAFTAVLAGVPRRAAVAGLLAYAALSEVIQTIAVLNRDGTVGDWLADAVGVAAGVGLWVALRPRSRR